jgi:hypothetical protein
VESSTGNDLSIAELDASEHAVEDGSVFGKDETGGTVAQIAATLPKCVVISK